MKFTRESEYGLNALVFLARQPAGCVLPLSEIARAAGLPENFLAKTFQKFAHHGVVRSFRGARRGYSLAHEPHTLRLRDLIEAVEGPRVFERCIFWSNHCNGDNPCPLHDGWSRLKPELVAFLEHTTLGDLVARREGTGPGSVRGRRDGEARW